MIDKPWLENRKWADNQILSGAKSAFIISWMVALVFSLLLIPMCLKYAELLDKAESEPLVYLAVLIPIISLCLFVASIKSTLDWMRTGPMPLRLDPFPGSIGGHVGGSVDTNIGYDASTTAAVTIECIHSYVSGSGKNRRRVQSVKWQNEGVCHKGSSAQGAAFKFRFDVPEDLPESDAERKSSAYHFWRVSFDIESADRKLNRSYEIPVFNTAEKSAFLKHSTESHQETLIRAESGLESLVDIRAVADGMEAWFAPYRRPTLGMFLLFFGAIFTGVGIAVGSFGAPSIFPISFTAIGVFFLLAGIYNLAKGLLVSITKEGVATRRFVFGLPITTKRMKRQNFSQFNIKDEGSMQSGKKTTMFYSLVAEAKDGRKLTVAERHTSQAEIELIKKKYESALG